MRRKTVKVFTHGDSLVMTIPAPFAEELTIGAGDFLLVSIEDHKIIAEKAMVPIGSKEKTNLRRSG